jgi:hypothetical protein
MIQFEILDHILELLNSSSSFYAEELIWKHMVDKVTKIYDGRANFASGISAYLDRLEQDRLVLVRTETKSKRDIKAYKISIEGSEFYLHGGYKAKEVRDEKDAQYLDEKRKLELDLLHNQIDTNLSVQETNTVMRNHIPVQKRQTNITICLGVLTLAFIIVSVWQECNDSTSRELKNIQKELQLNRRQSQGLQEELQRIDRSLRNMKTDSTNKGKGN